MKNIIIATSVALLIDIMMYRFLADVASLESILIEETR